MFSSSALLRCACDASSFPASHLLLLSSFFCCCSPPPQHSKTVINVPVSAGLVIYLSINIRPAMPGIIFDFAVALGRCDSGSWCQKHTNKTPTDRAPTPPFFRHFRQPLNSYFFRKKAEFLHIRRNTIGRIADTFGRFKQNNWLRLS